MQYFSLRPSYDASNFGCANFHSNNSKNDIHILWPGLQKLAKGEKFKYVQFSEIPHKLILMFLQSWQYFMTKIIVFTKLFEFREFDSPKLCLRYETNFTDKCYYGFGIEYRIYWCRGKENCPLKIQSFANFFLPISIHKMQKVQHIDFYAKKSIKWCIQSICIHKTIPSQ